MALIDFVGGSYPLNSSSVDCQRTINLFPEKHEIGNGKSNLFLRGTPGLKKFLELDEGTEIRAMYVDINEDLYVVAGRFVIRVREKVDAEGKIYQEKYTIGGLYTETGRVYVSENGLQLAFVDGKYLYIYVYSENSFVKVESDGWLGSNVIDYLEGYFIFVEPETQKYYISSLYDGKNINALDFASAEDNPDNIVTCKVLGDLVYMLGTRTIQGFANTGSADMAITKQAGTTFDVGCIARDSVAVASNTMFFLGRDNIGYGMVYAFNGGEPQKISNFAVDQFIQEQEKVEDASAIVYQEDGNVFYNLNFPSANTTWCYNLNLQMWHERRYLQSNGQETRHRAEHHVLWNKRHVVSDFEKPVIYYQSLKYYDDNGDPIRRMRRSPHFVGQNLERQFFNEFKLDIQVGTHNTEAKVYLRYSSDGGYSWTSYLEANTGKSGDYKKRVCWRRLGSAYDRTWEITISDPIEVIILNAYVS